MSRILFAVPSLSDPVSADADKKEGAILRLLKKRSFERIILLGFPGYRLNATLTEGEIAAKFPRKKVRAIPVEGSLLSYKAVFNALKTALDAGTAELRADDRLTFLLPSSMGDPILDCLLLQALSLPQKVEILQAKPTVDACVQQTFQTKENAFEWHDSASDEGKNATCLSSEQLDFLYRTWDKGVPFCLKTRDTEQQEAVSRAMRLYSQSGNRTYREVPCADIPESVSTELLWGYRAEMNGKPVLRDGFLTKESDNMSLLRWDAFSEDLKSDAVAFLSKSERHFMVLSTVDDPLLQVPTYALPNA